MGGLSLEPDEMRRLGYRTVDALVAALTEMDAPPLRRGTTAELAAIVGGPAPELGEPYEDALARLQRDVLPFGSRGDHPGFFAFIPFAGTWPGALGDFVASAYNVFTGSWMESAGASALELQVVSWFAEWMGYPSTAEGVLVPGGSIANLIALACARERATGDDVVGYVSDQAHSSVARAARVLGLRADQLRVLPSGTGHCLDPDVLRDALAADVVAGRQPLFLVAGAGSTNTGAVDPLRELAEFCREFGV
ncbi:MAG: aromatic-L-amino-acid/L-tryptophan decarboxylase, partial [Gaiellaceae bacterium]|nr:aromatic-L-amino-acid/L-tryptophan decarboxylase [Gaiellaceae bacterium]